MSEFAILTLITASVCISIAANGQVGGWSRIAPLFDVPPAYRGDYGSYSSVLSFDDGLPVKTPAEWAKRRDEIRRDWMRELGPWPSIIDKPHFKVLGEEHIESFTRKKIEIPVAPGRTTIGYLLTPDGSGRRPAILDVFYTPDAGAGLDASKARQMDFGYQLARRGFVSLCIGQDPWGDKSPLYYPDYRRAEIQPLSYLAYVACNCANLLASLPEVDADRIGVVGHSYGGKWAMFAGALCDRFSAVAISDPGIVFDESRPNVNYWEPWYLGYEEGRPLGKGGLPGPQKPLTGAYKRLRERGIDLHTLHALIAPRPFFVVGGSEDPPSRWQALNRLVDVNRLLGYDQRVGLAHRPDHTILPETNEQICLFFEHFLGNEAVKVEILEAWVEFHVWPFASPFSLRGATHAAEVTEARAKVRVRIDVREAAGRGAIYLGVAWSWPDSDLTMAARDLAMRQLSEQVATSLSSLCGSEPEHPTELGLRLHRAMELLDGTETPPILARCVCASPFDAAIHDAAGIALGRSAFDFYDEGFPIESADGLFGGGSASAAIRKLLRPPAPTLDAWLIVGPQMDIGELQSFIRERSYRCFKLRIPVEPGPDVERTVRIYEAVASSGVAKPRISVDSNEIHSDAAAVLDYLERLRAASPAAFATLQYLEQPTPRDLVRFPHDWRGVAAQKPVIVDEGLISISSFSVAAEQGWSGFALKTCKGHSFSLVAGAWAREHGLMLTMQDLTNPGLAAIHSALFAARVPTLNGIELNSPQFTPAANADWLPRLSGLLEPGNGVHRVPDPNAPGLGSTL